MNMLVRWYNQNRKIIWIVILTIIAIIALLQVLDNNAKKNTNDKNSSTNISTTTYNNDTYSVVTQKNIDEKTSNNSIAVINNFFDYCNNGNIEKAYNLLSSDCKEELYPTIEEFKQRYINVIFTEKKSCDVTLWITAPKRNTYKVQIMADLLETGQKEYMPIEDYYTITVEEGEYKLSISRYIAKEYINKSINQYGITINVLYKKIYEDFEIYEVEVINKTGSKLIFNTKENVKSIYLEDENNLKYIAFLNEIPDNFLEISNGMTKRLEIKFNRGYNPTINLKNIVFEDIKISNIEQKQNITIEL